MKQWIIILSLISTCCLFLPTAASAIAVSPSRQTIVVAPGSKTTVEITVINDENENITVFPEIQSFEIDEQTGETHIVDVTDQIEWFHVEEETKTLEPEEETKFQIQITPPQQTEPGAYYVALFAKKQGDGGQISVGTRVGSLLFLYIEGKIHEQVTTEIFSTETNWFINDTLPLTLKYKNQGNIHSIPTGNIILTDRKGNEIQKEEINKEQTKVLAGGSWEREFIFSHIGIKYIGPLYVQANMNYGIEQKTVHNVIKIWYIPKMIITGVIICGILFCIGIIGIRYAKKTS